MKPGDRIRLITRCSHALAGAHDNWGDIDFVLGQFELPVSDFWPSAGPAGNEFFAYVRDMLSTRGVQDEQLIALDEYLSGEATSHDPEDVPWEETGRFRIFITHLASHKDSAKRLKTALGVYGVDAFVAHEDLEPGVEWIRQIVAALHSCDAAVGLVHTGFRESEWCDQEIGIVLGRDRPVVPVRMDADPHGFFGTVQAVPGKDRDVPDVARDIVATLLSNKRTAIRLLASIVEALAEAGSFGVANKLAHLLADHASEVSQAQLDRLRAAQKTNTQVAGAYAVPDALSKMGAALASEDR